MTARARFITHPDVVIDLERPIPRWPLSERGRSRMRASLSLPWMGEVGHVFSSDEQKAIDGAEILSTSLGVPHTVLPGLSENDRSATGYLPADEFWAVVEQFFAEPEQSVRGWERAIDAQARVVAAVREGVQRAGPDVPAVFVSHGGVGALLLCHLKGIPITRAEEQPKAPAGAPSGAGGGHYLMFDPEPWELVHGWRAIDP